MRGREVFAAYISAYEILCQLIIVACDTPQVFRDPMKPLLEGRDTTEELMEGRTTFVIVHRPSTLRHCNVQLKVKEGRMA